MTDESDAVEDSDAEPKESLDEIVAGVLSDVDAAHDDYERGYVDADATLSVVMNHIERLRNESDDE